MANTSALPVRIGLLYDFPQMGDLLEKTLRLGIETVAATGRLDRDIELVERQSRGLPSGSEAEVTRAFAELVDEDVVAIIGPSISDNALIAAPLCDAARIPAINYSGGERTRSEWMFHYQVGSLEEEPAVLAQRMVTRGFRRAAVIFDQSPVGRRYAEYFESARGRLGLEVTDFTACVGRERAAPLRANPPGNGTSTRNGCARRRSS
jgi:branched-chain amino acid transport system substrate-binding protein